MTTQWCLRITICLEFFYRAACRASCTGSSSALASGPLSPRATTRATQSRSSCSMPRSPLQESSTSAPRRTYSHFPMHKELGIRSFRFLQARRSIGLSAGGTWRGSYSGTGSCPAMSFVSQERGHRRTSSRFSALARGHTSSNPRTSFHEGPKRMQRCGAHRTCSSSVARMAARVCTARGSRGRDRRAHGRSRPGPWREA